MHRDNLFFGVIVGLIVPMFGMLLLWSVKYASQNIMLDDFFLLLQENHAIIPKVLSLSLLTCIPLITYYKNRACMKTLKGIFIAIGIYALIIISYKYHIL